ncbi:hypothetical protein ETAE_0901 [Edwardsiella piscicida]|uniref:Uncharacterized protein n=1 Tax=Edwardsiella piscicida TaxID=1263550 RepID=A0AAU8P1Y2_EDWPI|nr:hypothetical protein ETAE_0901 [Edwardsiella tarda EIB202]
MLAFHSAAIIAMQIILMQMATLFINAIQEYSYARLNRS